jgi:hypothetical protein
MTLAKLIVAYHKAPTGINARRLVSYCDESPVIVRDLHFQDREAIAAARRHVAAIEKVSQ